MIRPTRRCNGGTNDTFPCDFDNECPGGTCSIPGACSDPAGTPCYNPGGACGAGGTCTVPGQACPPLDLIGNDPLPVPPQPKQGPANGPYLIAETGGSNSLIDRCGDLFAQGSSSACDENMDGLWDPTVIDFENQVTLPCVDVDDDGLVNIPVCGTWGNQANQVFMGQCSGGADDGLRCMANNDCAGVGVCDFYGVCNDDSTDASQIGLSCVSDSDCGGGSPAGTCAEKGVAGRCSTIDELTIDSPAKCQCENIQSNIPIADLSLTCTQVNQCTITGGGDGGGLPCDDNSDCPGGVDDICVTPPLTAPEFSNRYFDLTFANSSPALCTPDPMPADLNDERFQCGTAAFVRFELTDDQMGLQEGILGPVVGESTGGNTAVSANPDGGITWDPRNELSPEDAMADPGSLNVIYPGHSGTLRFKYRLGDFPDPPGTGMVTITGNTLFSHVAGDFSMPIVQALEATCNLNVDNTWAAVADVAAFDADGRVGIEWTVTTEVDTKHYELWRFDPGADRWQRVGSDLPSALRGDGSVYRVVDERAAPGSANLYQLVEVDQYGRRRAHGPYEVAASTGGRTDGPAAKARFDAERADLGVLQGALPLSLPDAEAQRVNEARREYLRATARPARLTGGAAVKVDVRETGMHAVDALTAAALWDLPEQRVRDMFLAGAVRLENRGQELAWSASADGSALYFWGEDVRDVVEAQANVYWLRPETGSPAAVIAATAGAAPGGSFAESLRLEDNSIAGTNVARDPATDYWFWGLGLQAGHPTNGTRVFDIDVPDVAGGSADLTARFYSGTDTAALQEHTAIVSVNGVEVGQTSWDDQRHHEATFSVPAGTLVAGANQIEVTAFLGANVPTSIFFVDRFTIDYDRQLRAVGDALVFTAPDDGATTIDGFSSGTVMLFDVTETAALARISGALVEPDGSGGFRVSFDAEEGHRYVATTASAISPAGMPRLDSPSDLRGGVGAEYVVLAPAHLVGSAQVLASYRSKSYSTLVADIEDVYDEFNHGIADPKAISDLVAWAWSEWSVQPRYLVLVGAGTFDFKGYNGLGGNLVPPSMVGTPSGLYASDQIFGDVTGDGVPEVAVGRIPALTADDMAGYLAKVKVSQHGGGADWRGTVLFVSDDEDDAGDFARTSDRVAAYLPNNYLVDEVRLDDLSVDDARQEIFDVLDRGVGLVHYVGHGGVTQLADEGLLTKDDVANLANARRPPIVTALTCIAGRYEMPLESLSERMVLAGNGGAAAMWAPSGLSFNVDAERLASAFARAAGTDGITIGDAVRSALEEYEQEGFFRHLLYIYNVFGDPALPMN